MSPSSDPTGYESTLKGSYRATRARLDHLPNVTPVFRIEDSTPDKKLCATLDHSVSHGPPKRTRRRTGGNPPVDVEALYDRIAFLQAEVAGLSGPGAVPSSTLRRNIIGQSHPTIAAVKGFICNEFNIAESSLISSSRKTVHAWPRALAFYLCCALMPQSLTTIGFHFGHRSHTMVLRTRRRVARLRAKNPALNLELEKFEQRILHNHHACRNEIPLVTPFLVAEVVRFLSLHYSMSEELIQSRTRRAKAIRYIAIHLCVVLTPHPPNLIGQFFSGLNPVRVREIHNGVVQRRETDAEFDRLLTTFENNLRTAQKVGVDA